MVVAVAPMLVAATRAGDTDDRAAPLWSQLDTVLRQAGQQCDALLVDLVRAGTAQPELAVGAALTLSAVALALLAARLRTSAQSSRVQRSALARETEPSDAATGRAPPRADPQRLEPRDFFGETAQALLNAYTAIENLKPAGALQLSLFRELEALIQRLGFSPAGGTATPDHVGHDYAQMALILKDLRRLIGIAEAAAASMLSATGSADVPRNRREACLLLGVNANADDDDIKRAVNGLRRCWHPDFALDGEDRRIREQKIKQINNAWDIICETSPDGCAGELRRANR